MKNRNLHHWDFWLFAVPYRHYPTSMPKKYVIQMICDLEAMSIKFNNEKTEYFYKEIKPIANFDQATLDLFSKHFK